MNNFWVRLIVFAVFNFGALALGSLFTNSGADSSWYQSLQKAPWNPPGFMFGLAWTTIMVCFSIYMAFITVGAPVRDNIKLYVIYFFQWFLNVLWNPTFFFFHETSWALVVICALFAIVTYFMVLGFKRKTLYGVLVLPYFVWLIIAISLNAYIVAYN